MAIDTTLKLRLIDAVVRAFDDRLDHEERPPDGDDYNDLSCAVRGVLDGYVKTLDGALAELTP